MLNWNLITPRAEEFWVRDFQLNPHSEAGTAPSTVDSLDFATVKPLRITFIILACLNAAAAFATAAGTLWESHTTAKRNNQSWTFRSFRTASSNTAALFPFILSCGIVVQGTIFAAAQSRGLTSLTIQHCSLTTQFMLLALFITPYIHFVFGLEVAIRALHRCAFSARGRWNTAICLGAVALLLLMTVSSVLLVQPSEDCFASLMWFLESYKLGCLGLLITITIILIIAGALICFRLRKTSRIELRERTEASHLVYYLTANCLLNTLMLPFFLHVSIMNPSASDAQARDLSTLAGVVVNLSGFITGGLYLFLRLRKTTTIRSKEKDNFDVEGTKTKHRPWTPSDAHFSKQIARPISPPKSLHRTKGARAGSTVDDALDEKSWFDPHDQPPKPRYSMYLKFKRARVSQQTSNTVDTSRVSRYPSSKAPSSKAQKDKNLANEEKSLLQTEQPSYADAYTALVHTMSQEIDPANHLPLPPRIHGGHHQRMSSTISSATVQIGLRLSNPNDMQLHNSTYLRNSGEHYLGCPNQMQANASRKRSPLAPLDTAVSGGEQGQGELEGRPETIGTAHTNHDVVITLSPAVYSPAHRTQAKVMSPTSPTPYVRPYRLREQISPVPLHDGPEIKHDDWI